MSRLGENVVYKRIPENELSLLLLRQVKFNLVSVLLG